MTLGGTKHSHVAYKFSEFVVVTNRNNNTLENHENITLNKDDDLGGSQIPVMWQCISITIPLVKLVHLCKNLCMPSSFVHFLELLIHAF